MAKVDNHLANKISNTKANKKYRILETDSIKPYQSYPLTLFRIEAKIPRKRGVLMGVTNKQLI